MVKIEQGPVNKSEVWGIAVLNGQGMHVSPRKWHLSKDVSGRHGRGNCVDI